MSEALAIHHLKITVFVRVHPDIENVYIWEIKTISGDFVPLDLLEAIINSEYSNQIDHGLVAPGLWICGSVWEYLHHADDDGQWCLTEVSKLTSWNTPGAWKKFIGREEL